MTRRFSDFREIWLVDFEFSAPPGFSPILRCLVALEIRSGRKFRIWEQDLLKMKEPPYSVDGDTLFIAYYAPAELGCHLSLGWPLPKNVLDLYVEFRRVTNGHWLPHGHSLLGALHFFGHQGIDAIDKETMRELAIRGGPWTPEERDALLDYCESDVISLASLFQSMESSIDLPRALLRGRYLNAVARMEKTGIPLNKTKLERLLAGWEFIQEHLIDQVDSKYGVYDGRRFKSERFLDYLYEAGINWPFSESGRIKLDDDTFKEMSRAYPDQLRDLYQLRATLAQMRKLDLSVGPGGRNRTMLSAFKVKTGRNQPSSNRFIFGNAKWLRGLIEPPPGFGCAYLDWSQQEFGIAAALSGDAKMQTAYLSGDSYLAFAKQAGAVPETATAKSHASERSRFKQCALAVQYGGGAKLISLRAGQSLMASHDLLLKHHETYSQFWAWSDATTDFAMLNGKLHSAFGWQLLLDMKPNPRSIQNFPMQANGAEILRIACCLATEQGVAVCAPVHDALLIEAPLDLLDRHVDLTRQAMLDASIIVLEGFPLRTDVKTFRSPENFLDQDDGAKKMWDLVWQLLASAGY